MSTVADLRAKLCAIALGASIFIGGVKVVRSTLDLFSIEGTSATIDEAVPEIAYLAEEREGIANPPSLHRAAEIAERRMFRRGVRGAYRVRNAVARWTSTEGSSPRIDREALIELAEWAQFLGIETAIVGNELWVQGARHGRAA